MRVNNRRLKLFFISAVTIVGFCVCLTLNSLIKKQITSRVSELPPASNNEKQGLISDDGYQVSSYSDFEKDFISGYSDKVDSISSLSGDFRTTQNAEYTVIPVVFFPTNYPEDQAVVSHTINAMQNVRNWYKSQNDGKTFSVGSPVVIKAKHDSFWYWCKKQIDGCVLDNPYANIFPEMREVGLRPLDPNAQNVKYLLIFMGGGGFASGYMITGGAVATVGDITIYPELDGNCDRVRESYFTGDQINSKTRCMDEMLPTTKAGTGAIAHELGHAFLLPHTVDNGYSEGSYEVKNSIMSVHWIFPATILAPNEKKILSQIPNSYFFGNQGATVTPGMISCDPYAQGESVGKLNVQDLLVVRREVAGLDTTNKGSCLTNPPDDKTGIADLLRMRRILVGLEN